MFGWFISSIIARLFLKSANIFAIRVFFFRILCARCLSRHLRAIAMLRFLSRDVDEREKPEFEMDKLLCSATMACIVPVCRSDGNIYCVFSELM